MGRREYGQQCALARALDVVGERWTLLIVRELLIRPKRYTDLLENLPAMGTNLLSARLKELEVQGVVEHQSRPHGRAYRLTERGRALEAVVRELVRWAVAADLAIPSAGLHRPEWDAIALRALFRPERAATIDECYALELNGQALRVCIRDGLLDIQPGIPDKPAARIVTDGGTAIAIITGKLHLNTAIDAGAVRVHGSRAAARRLFRSFVGR